MKVDDLNADLIDYSKRLNNRLRDDINRKENDIKKIKVSYEKKIEDVKDEGSKNYTKTLNKNDELLILAATDYEEKLNNYKNNLIKAKETIEQSETSLKQDHQEKVKDIKKNNDLIIEEKIFDTKINQENISNQMNNKIKSITDKAMDQRRQTELATKIQSDALSNEFNSKGLSEENNFRSKQRNDLVQHKEEVSLQQKDLNTLALKQFEKSKNLLSEKTIVQKEELNFLNNHQKDIMIQKQNDFKDHYKKMVKEHNEILSNLKTHFDSDVKKMVKQTSSQKQILEDKSEDSFYAVTTLEPNIIEDKKEILVSLKVPEHEKENVHLSVQGRGVKMTLSRKFTDSYKGEDGMTNRSTRNELFSKEFPSIDLLNPKLIDQKYENGILTYRIQKL